MPPLKRKQCCVPHCPNVQEVSKKQFFKIGANVEARNKWRVGKSVLPKSQILHCCEDHFDLPNDAINYIRYKYCPGTKLKLRQNVLPHKNLPVNICRLCLNLIYSDDDMVDVSPKKGGENVKVFSSLLPEIDLSLTIEPVICVKCFDPLERFYRLKQKALMNEVVVVNCIKHIARRSPKRLMKSCEIDLFDEYNDIKAILQKDDDETETQSVEDLLNVLEGDPDAERLDEEIVIQLEDPQDVKYTQEEIKSEGIFKGASEEI